ncbi:MAG: murein biosynthesis integral membrane protein MurJ [Patescibacteria group bacterium]|nr:murein biosynthesis integral membrane protein MurJ [Patescibacteria group bacterium]
MRKLFCEFKDFLFSSQETVFSAAGIIIFTIILSKILGLFRNNILLQVFTADEISLFFAAFRLPDTLFEILVFGTFSSSFIPVFSKAVKKDRNRAWNIASTVMNLGVAAIIFIGIFIMIFADNIYKFVAPGYDDVQRQIIIEQTRILLVAQIFFVASYVLTGILESLKKFLIPALAPVFYNLGIILITYFFGQDYGLIASSCGALFGAMIHFAIQLPLAISLGFRIRFNICFDEDVKKIGKLAIPRLLEIIFIQASKMIELFLASIISVSSYAHFYLANTLQSIPVSLFGLSIAKAALPVLSDFSDDLFKFRRAVNQLLVHSIFMVLPFVVMIIVLRVPIVRIVYGRELFDWQSTYQTSLVLSAFAMGILAQVGIALLSRAFYALHDTKTPVIVAIFTICGIIFVNFFLIKILGVGIWGLAASYSFCITFQFIILYFFLFEKIGGIKFSDIIPILRLLIAGVFSGVVMFFLLKFFDKSVWIKKMSFLGKIEIAQNIPFEIFVLDTRYANSLLVLTFLVGLFGIIFYLLFCFLVGSREVVSFFYYLKQIFRNDKKKNSSSNNTNVVSVSSNETTISI